MSSNLEQLTRETKEKFKSLKLIPDVNLPDSIKNTLIPIFKQYWNGNCYFNNSTFIIETSSQHYAIMPNQYFYIAKELFPLAIELKNTFDIFDKSFKDDVSKKAINTLQDSIKKGNKEDVESYLITNIPNASNIFTSMTEEQKNNFCYLIGNLDDSKKFGNLEKNTYRTTPDLYGSYLLNIAPLTTAESGSFGDLMYALVSNQAVYSDLISSIQIDETKNFSIRELFFKYMVDKSSATDKEKYPNALIRHIDEMSQEYIDDIKKPIFEYTSAEEFETIIETIKNEPSFIAREQKNDERGSGGTEYLAAINNYYEFLKTLKLPVVNSLAKYNQIIYYGVPGSGKSYEIDKIVKKLEAQTPINNVKYTRRVVFHPEYTNADFIGQILPTMEGTGIKYNFIPGHFTKILKDAYRNPTKQFALVIEEINRGNAAAIFGDVFQLLDRLNENESDYSANDQFTYTYGWSKYGIDNSDIIHEIFKNSEGKAVPLNLVINGTTLHLNYNSAIRLPPNLSIFATMNTSDQNVFTLDNAFQRRWDMQLVKNECNDSSQMNSKITINNKCISWKDFQEQINKVIGEKSNESGLSSMEDKRIGCWFVKAENGIIIAETFANKVLKYLWDDAFKFYHTEIFKEGIKNFEELQKEFFNNGFDVFNDVCELKDKIHTVDGNSTSDFQLEAE